MVDLLKKTLFSTRLMAVLFFVFAVAMAFGTFIESWYSTDTARIWIYNAWWFEVIMVLFVINFIGNIKKYKLLKWEQWPVLLLHLSFILIISGAFVTRYISFEGMMPVREGQSVDYILTHKTYLSAMVDGEMNGEMRRKMLQEEVLLTPEAEKSSLPWRSDFNGQPFKISYAGFIKGAEEGLIEDENGDTYLKIVEAGGGERHDHYLKEGEISSIHNVLFAFNKPTDGAININITDTLSTIKSPFEGEYMRMADQAQGKLVKDSLQTLQMRSLYSTAGMQFVFPEPPVKGHYGVVEAKEKHENMQDAVIVDVTVGNETKQVKLLGGRGFINDPKTIQLGGLDFHLSYGSIRHQLPFSIKLNDFIAQKYPGTEKGYASFESKVTVQDERPFDYHIYMNHVLDHKGYRFFQANFDPDEKGSVFSVNHDYWGTWITYIGYFLLYAGLMGIMFFGKTRFRELGKKLEKVKSKKAALTGMLAFMFMLNGFAQESHQHTEEHVHTTAEDQHAHNLTPSSAQVDSVLNSSIVSKEHADKFGRLVIQDDGGRMKPINTFAAEMFRKLHKSNTFKGMDQDQVMLSMMKNPSLWYHVDFIYVTKKNDSIRQIIGVPSEQEFVRATDFFDQKGTYKLAPYLQEAYATNTPNQFQKAFKEFDLKLGLLNRALSGEILKIFPLTDNENNKWISRTEFNTGQFEVQDSLYANFINNSIPYYLMMLRQAQTTGDYAEADKMLEAFKQNQKNYGGEVLPSENKIKAEILYNKINIFQKLMMYYLLVGLLMFVLIITQIFKDAKWTQKFITGGKYVLFALFVLQTAGLAFRWYISGHAPWSDAYESVIYVGWATMGMGLLFARKSDMTVAATAFVTAIILWGAHMNWLDPSIANLQPVLNSYWLMIHVAVIVGSYGPFTLGMILGLVALLLIIFTSNKNKKKMQLALQEITIINELALTVGLVMLTIGNFLGGQWANESWGRYWGWDPKETWALISIMVYAFVIHMRLVPGLRGRWAFNFASVVAYASIMMTYFGVNFYLSGLHSYASGDKVITPNFVYYSVAVVAVIGAISYWKGKKYYKNGNGVKVKK
ncbi:cytochrome c biogenesis protein [Zhouia amylolytica]|uniref:ABC-type transport system involved in cytochrome c biogenesis, permease component n=1 Tax=Zhouia amylolytica AD3 TaxID=1286632 RepID=W2UQP2_9FLAO|nr:cytochrome c biogenesis protein CcsA [Zhouia amylolytica]ETN96333.1 ABC-type transport system involved in cytochrome c biogenesis, permease component [Zhouia amylolytica AD3]